MLQRIGLLSGRWEFGLGYSQAYRSALSIVSMTRSEILSKFEPVAAHNGIEHWETDALRDL